MKLFKNFYEKATGKKAPYYYNYSIFTIINKPLRKFVTQVIAPNCPFNHLRVMIYKLCGFKIGKHTFIGMKCYFDDMCYDLLKVGNNVTISYGVYFACHGKNQGHYPITIEDGAYIGMRACVISKNKGGGYGNTVGRNATVGACALINRDVPEGCVAVGIPCRIISGLTSETRCRPHEELEVLQSCSDAIHSTS